MQINLCTSCFFENNLRAHTGMNVCLGGAWAVGTEVVPQAAAPTPAHCISARMSPFQGREKARTEIGGTNPRQLPQGL